MPIDSTPFEKLRARALVGYAALTFITTLIIVAIFFRNRHDPYPEAAEGILLYLLFFLFTLGMLSRADLILQSVVWHLSHMGHTWAI